MSLRVPLKAVTATLGVMAIAGCVEQPTARVVEIPSAAPLRSEHVPPGQAKKQIVPGQIIVRYREGVDAESHARGKGARKKQDLLLARAVLLEVPAGEEEAFVAALQNDPAVELAEVDEMMVLTPCEVGGCETPTDERNTRYKWDLHNTGFITNNATGLAQATGKADADIDWLEAYDYLRTQAPPQGGAVIGIIDSGIRPTHNEVTGRIVAAQNFATSYASTFIQDSDGHGTHVATIAAGRNNGVGSTGVAYAENIKLINAKACERYVTSAPNVTPQVIQTLCPTSSQANAIVFAVNNGANVLNLSIGGSPTATSGSTLVRDALAYAISKNVLPICAAGNDNYPNTAFPARFADCMAVAATNWGDQRASYSNYGGDVEVSAPGGAGNPTGSASSLIYAASNSADNLYTWKAGTSMAAPQVAGLAALLYASGMTSVAEVRQRIVGTADALPGTTGMGAGRINVYRALTLKEPSAPPVAGPGVLAGGPEGSPTSFTAGASFDPNGKPLSAYSWTFGDGGTSMLANPQHVYADNGIFPVTLTVTDQAGLTGSKTLTLAIANVAPSVTAALSASSILSGESVTLNGAFGDPGLLDSPWTWNTKWGNGDTSGQRTVQGPFAQTRRYCAPGAYAVTLAVTDKDGGAGSSAAQPLAVGYNAMAVDAPGPFNTKAPGTLPVSIAGSATLDVSQIDWATVVVGDGVGTDAGVAVKNDGTLHAAIEGGILVVHVDRQAITALGNVTDATTRLVVRARLKDGCTELRGVMGVVVK